MKKLIAICLAMLLCVSLLSVTASADASASISVASVAGTPGNVAQVTVNLNSNPGLAAMLFQISYDDSILELTSIDGVSFGTGSAWTTSKTTGKALWDASEDSTYTGPILTLTFKVKDGADCGSANVTVSCISANNKAEELVSIYSASGKVTVNHVWGDWSVVTPATCTTAGTEERKCSHCGEVETRTIDATGHAWGDWSVVTPATCTTDGVEKRVCSNCGAEETRVLAATGHNPDSAWHMDENNHWHECTCGSHFDEAAHSWVDKENYLGQTYKKCSVCGYETDPVGEIPDDVPPTGDITILYMGGALILLAIACTAVVIVKRKTV